MATGERFRVNYYLGALLAQGGDLWIENATITFCPTSALDRAMGAKNVEIPFQKIRSMNYAGAFSRAFSIKTEDKVHKFEGAQTRKVWELLEKALPNVEKTVPAKMAVLPPAPVAPLSAPLPPDAAPAAPASVAKGLVCEKCQEPLQPGYSFCPRCAERIKGLCPSCKRSIDPGWTVCAFCGWKF